MGPAWVILFILTTIITATGFFHTVDDVRFSFENAQKFYASGAYDQAIEKYIELDRAESHLLDMDTVTVKVGKITASIKYAALYQVGNSYSKIAQEKVKLAERATDLSDRDAHMKEADANFDRAVEYFLRVEEESKERPLKILAGNRLIQVLYDAGRYQRIIPEANEFVLKYPRSAYMQEVLYNKGWSQYKLEDYAGAIATFEELVKLFPEGYQADRAVFQIAECHSEMGSYEEAISYYGKVVERANLKEITDADRLRMEKERLAGLVEETILELAGKALMKIGDTYVKMGDYERAIDTYWKVIIQLPQQAQLVEDAYLRITDSYMNMDDFQNCIRTYRRAIDSSSDKLFQARMQFQVAKRYHDLGYLEEAIRESRVYALGYGEVAAQAGFPLDKVGYRIGRCFYDLGERYSESGEGDTVRESYLKAVSEYQKTLDDYPETDLRIALRFNIALSYQRIGDPEFIEKSLPIFLDIASLYPKDEYAVSSLFQIARIYHSKRDYKDSQKIYRQIIDEYPDATQIDVAYFELGISLRGDGDYDGAVEILLKVPRGSELYSRSRLEVGEILIRRNDMDRALDILSDGMGHVSGASEMMKYRYMIGKILAAKENYRKAVTEFSMVIDMAEDEDLVESSLYGRGSSLYMLENYREAAADFSKLTSAKNMGIKNSAYRMLGMCNIKMGRTAEAIGNYRNLADNTEDNRRKAEYLLLLAELYHGAKRYDETIKACREILVMDIPDEKTELPYFVKEKAYYLTGNAYDKLGDYGNVTEAFAKGVERYPDSFYSADMQLGIGLSYFQLGDYDRCIGALKLFLEKYSDSMNSVYAYYYIAYSQFNQRDFDLAAPNFDRVWQGYPRNEVAADAALHAGECYYNLERYRESLERYERVITDYPVSEEADDALYNAGWASLQMNRAEDMVRYFQKLVEEFPESEFSGNAQFSIGDYYYNKREYEKALEAYEKVLRYYPNSEVAPMVPSVARDLEENIAYTEYGKAITVFLEAQKTEAPAKFAEAVPLFEKVVKEFPGTESEIGALSNLGVCYEYLHEWRKAVDVFDRLLSKEGLQDNNSEAYIFAKMHKDWIVENRF